jgi:hypothetical protein
VRINLAGIRPQFETAVPLGDGKDYRDRTLRLPLPLKKEGAYLVVCRGENLHASGLVLITPLGVEVQADPRSGQVRATVKDLVADRYLSNVEVKVIGSFNEDFVSGTSDLRGVFVAEGIRGVPTVLAESPPGRYAFFRGPGPRQDVAATDFGAALPRKKVQQAGETDVAAASGKPAEKPTTAVAAKQPEAAAAVTKPDASEIPESVNLFGTSPKEERIRAILNRPTVIDLVDDSFANVIDYLKDYHGIEIQFDRKALEEVGFATDKQVTINLKGVSLRSALKLLLRAEGLTYMVQDEVLLITTPDEAANKLITAVYPVADLVLPPDAPADYATDRSGASWADFDSLIDLITSSVQPTTWDEVGGPGSVAPFENNMTLVISQTEEGHEEIAKVLRTLRSVKTGKGTIPSVRAPAGQPRAQGMMKGGGMGGGGGFGVMGGGLGGPAPAEPSRGRGAAASAAIAADRDADLLGGLQQSNQRFQRKHVDRLKGMYQGGMGGGMGGVGAGAAY